MIRHIHFQLTMRCNLRCPFCGQYRLRIPEQSMQTWLDVAEQLPQKSKITLWGGEPLLYPEFIPLAEKLSEMGFELEIVTNAVLIDEAKAKVLRERFSSIYISLDGGKAEHNSVRGAGVFEKVSENIRLLEGRRGKLYFLSTLHDGLVSGGINWLRELEALGPDRITLQPLIYLDKKEITAAEKLGFCNLDRWERNDDTAYRIALEETLKKIAAEKYRMPVKPMRHDPEKVCHRPECALHISPEGETCFCTDFTGYSIGNVFKNKIGEVINSDAAKRFRAMFQSGEVPFCDHCPWRSQYQD